MISWHNIFEAGINETKGIINNNTLTSLDDIRNYQSNIDINSLDTETFTITYTDNSTDTIDFVIYNSS